MSEEVARLLARGGRILGLAAIAHSRGRDGAARWNVLARETCSAADQIVDVMESGVAPGSMRTALSRAMGREPATSRPAWSDPLLADPGLIEEVGRRVSVGDEVLAGAGLSDGDRSRGLAALGMALCRGLDGAMALASELPPDEGRAMMRCSRMAQAVARPNEPSETRAAVRRVLGE